MMLDETDGGFFREGCGEKRGVGSFYLAKWLFVILFDWIIFFFFMKNILDGVSEAERRSQGKTPPKRWEVFNSVAFFGNAALSLCDDAC